MNQTSSAPNSDSVLFAQSNILRLAQQSASCKVWSAIGTSVLLFIVFGHPGTESMLWAAGPLAILGFADASYVFRARRIAEAAAQIGTNTVGLLQLQTAFLGFKDAMQGLTGLLSFSVWPYYVALAGVAVGLGHSISTKPQASLATPLPRPATAPAGLSRFGANPAFNTQPSASRLPAFNSTLTPGVHVPGVNSQGRLPGSPPPSGFHPPTTGTVPLTPRPSAAGPALPPRLSPSTQAPAPPPKPSPATQAATPGSGTATPPEAPSTNK